MPNVFFAKNGKAVLPTKYHGEVTLSAGKWSVICAEPEREYYVHNGDKIATTLINPDEVRLHGKETNQFLYYKLYASILVTDTSNFSPANGIWFCVVIDQSAKRVCTVYPVLRPKPGTKFTPAVSIK